MRQIEKSQREWADGRRQRDKEILQLRRKVRRPLLLCPEVDPACSSRGSSLLDVRLCEATEMGG